MRCRAWLDVRVRMAKRSTGPVLRGCGQPQVAAANDRARESGSSRPSSISPISFRPFSKTDRLVVDSPEIAAFSTKGVERRQVTALFADLTGYSTLANELDGERVHEITNRYRAMVDEIIESYDGIVPRHFGDAVLGLFGYPTAHSNDPERAIRNRACDTRVDGGAQPRIRSRS